MHGLTTAVAASGWSLGGSIMTFAIPVGLFVVVASVLFFLYSRPPVAPGHSDVIPGRAAPQVTFEQAAAEQATAQAAADAGQPGGERETPGTQGPPTQNAEGGE